MPTMTPPPSPWQRLLVLGSLGALLLWGGWLPYPSARWRCCSSSAGCPTW
ncbi:MAG: hypothetical protein WKG07_23490 [Hymenobacter sp.]